MAIRHSHDFLIQWHLTERCNLRCSHCYQTGRKTAELSLSVIEDVTAEIADMFREWSEIYEIEFSPSFNLTGGEPFLRQDIVEILRMIGNRGFEIYLLSNGTLIDMDKAKALSDCGIKGVQVSLEGPENIHDSIRGKGSFSSSLSGITDLLKEEIPVTVNMTLSDLNAGFFTDMIGLASSLGVQRLGFSRLVPSGRGMKLVNSMLDAKRVRKIYEDIYSAAHQGIEIVTGDPVANQMHIPPESSSSDIPSGGCAAGISGLTILSDGTITPCRRMPIPVGNVIKDSIREIWTASPVFARLRDRNSYKGRCGVCRRWSNCRGCRAIAYACSQAYGRKDFLVEDPQCFIYS
jgi:AdoMet-dependent heme synthase